MSKTGKWILYSSIILVVLFIISYPKIGIWFKSDSKEPAVTTNNTNTKPPATLVKTTTVQYESLENKITSSGTILPNEEVSLRSEISGKISALYFREGDFVSSGSILLTMNSEDLLARLKKLEYTKTLNETKEYRQRQLLDKQAISQQEYDIALTELNSINTEIEIAKIEIEKTKIRAPFSGVIGFRQIALGSYLTPSVEIAKITSINPVKVQFAIPAKYSLALRLGSKVQFFLENSEEIFEGTISAIEPKIDETTRTIVIRAVCPNPNQKLIPGAFVKVNIVLEKIENSIMLPTEAIIPEMNTNKVFVVKNGKASSVEVKLGQRNELQVQIMNGLSVGDTVITSGVLKVKTGTEVKIQ
jgi:membrane fusion protein, multidrug efflux system